MRRSLHRAAVVSTVSASSSSNAARPAGVLRTLTARSRPFSSLAVRPAASIAGVRRTAAAAAASSPDLDDLLHKLALAAAKDDDDNEKKTPGTADDGPAEVDGEDKVANKTGGDDGDDETASILAAAAPGTVRSGVSLSLQQSPLKPSEIVAELEKHIVGQTSAKRSVAIALRNRWRRLQLSDDLREEVQPKNILMIGPTGCGKTEIARRLAKLAQAPFVKVEATKFTEVGFHGRDVDKIIQDLVENSIQLTRQLKLEQDMAEIERIAETQILDALTGKNSSPETRKSFRDLLRKGELDKHNITIEAPAGGPNAQGFPLSMEGAGPNPVQMNQIFAQLGKMMGGHKKERRKMPIAEARRVLVDMELEARMDAADVTKEAIQLAEQNGIVFIDEIDKICSHGDARGSADASAEGVQRDLLPLIEGSVVNTKHGNVKTDHILFITSGAFHFNSPSDLLPELQGRLPIRVELAGLTEKDLYRILTEPQANLVVQQTQLLRTEGLDVRFDADAVKEMARIAAEVNHAVENIGARRLHTIMERIVEEISFFAPELLAHFKEGVPLSEQIKGKYVVTAGEAPAAAAAASDAAGDGAAATEDKTAASDPLPVLHVTKKIVRDKIGDLLEKTDFTRFIL